MASAEPILIDYVRPRDWHCLAQAAALLYSSAGDYIDARV